MTDGTPGTTGVRRALDHWVARLCAPGEPLLHHRDHPDAGLELTHAHPSGLAMLLAGRATRLSALVREPLALDDARRRARALRDSERGRGPAGATRPVWLAVGTVSWPGEGSTPDVLAPVLLRPCTLRPRGATQDDVELDLGPDVVLNPALVRLLAERHGQSLDGPALAALAVGPDGFDPAPVLQRVADVCAAVPGACVEQRLLLGAWSDAAAATALDLVAHRDRLADHDLVPVLAGLGERESTGTPAGAGPRESTPERHTTAVPVVRLDEEQRAVAAAVAAGGHLVVEAPVVSGWVDAVVATVAEGVPRGRTTLVVGPPTATAAVARRLGQLGLDDVSLTVGEAATARRRALRDLVGGIDRAGRVPAPAEDDLEQRAAAHERLLDRHTRALHGPRAPWGVSAYDAQLALVRLTDRHPAPRSRVRLPADVLDRVTPQRLAELESRLVELAATGALASGPAQDPWYGARLETAEEAGRALAVAADLAGGRLAALRERADALAESAGRPRPVSIADVAETLDLLAAVRRTLDALRPEAFDSSLADLVAATGSREWRTQHGVRLGSLARQRLRGQARRMLRPGLPPEDLHALLVTAHEQRLAWQRASGPGSRPTVPEDLDEVLDSHRQVVEGLSWLGPRLAGTLDGGDLAGAELEALQARLARLAGQPAGLELLPTVVALRDELAAAGLRDLVEDLADRGVAGEDVGSELALVWWASVLQAVSAADPAYGQHDGAALSRAVEDLTDLEPARLARGAAAVQRAAARRAVTEAGRRPDQLLRLRDQSGRNGTGAPLGRVVADCREVTLAARPCWLMAPLTVVGALPVDAGFDTLVLLDAHRLAPEQVVAALSRAGQVVVVGDPAMPGPVEGGPSVLDLVRGALPRRRLVRDVRSLDDRVGAFSRDRVHPDVVAAPAPRDPDLPPPVGAVLVDGTGPIDPEAEAVTSTGAEVEAAVSAVVTLVRERPAESVAVVALSPAHAVRVDESLRIAAADEPALAAAIDRADEPLVVVAARQAAGIERDAVVLTVGYGRTPHGRVLHTFGELSAEGGERLVAAATTCARRRLTVVASVGAADLDPARLSAPGPRLLRDLLAWAASGGVVLEPSAAAGGDAAAGDTAARDTPAGDRPAGDTPAGDGRVEVAAGLDPLVEDLRRRLVSAGMVAEPGPGEGGERVQLAVRSRRRGAWLAVETDGPAYARAGASEDRDVLRAERLRERGWGHLRVWSTDVFRDPAREVARIARALRGVEAVAEQRGADAPGPVIRWDGEEPAGGVTVPQRGGVPVGTGTRGPRPYVVMGRPIEDYPAAELDAVVAWVCSDGLLRTEAEVVALTRQQLGLTRRSARVDAEVAASLARVRATAG